MTASSSSRSRRMSCGLMLETALMRSPVKAWNCCKIRISSVHPAKISLRVLSGISCLSLSGCVLRCRYRGAQFPLLNMASIELASKSCVTASVENSRSAFSMSVDVGLSRL